ncbi:MAG: hypothetical protein OEM93_10400 [Rhodospirillales bacterium]|nr:hypothetical protein [Rhodospirillales bacterium]
MTRKQRRSAALERAAESIEWPTVLLTTATYGAFGLLTWNYDTLPWWLLLPLGGYLVALHGSLQHEATHGHPTPWPRVNELLVGPSLWLWVPTGSTGRPTCCTTGTTTSPTPWAIRNPST